MNKSSVKNSNWKLIVGLLTFGWITIWVYRTALTPIYPQISEFFGGISDLQLGQISSFYFLGYVIMQIPAGILIDRVGQRKVLFPGYAMFALGAILVGISKSVNLVFLGSLLAGVGSGCYYGVAYSLTSVCIPEEKRSVATALVNSGSAVGSGLGIMFSTVFVAEKGLPWQYTMILTLALITIAVLLFNRYIENVSGKGVAVEEVKEENNESILKLLFSRKLVTVYFLYFATCFAYYLIDTWLPNFLTTERAMSQSTTGIVTTVVFFAAIPGALIFSKFADMYPKKKVSIIFALELIAALFLFLGIFSTNRTLMVIFLVLYGFFGKVAVEPIIISWLSTHIPRNKVATALGLFNFFGMSSSILAPTITGIISDMFSTKVPAFNLAAIIIVVATLLFTLVNRNKKSA